MSQRNVCYFAFYHDTEPKSIADRYILTVGTKRFRCAEVWFLPAAEKNIVHDVTEKRLLLRFFQRHTEVDPFVFSFRRLEFEEETRNQKLSSGLVLLTPMCLPLVERAISSRTSSCTFFYSTLFQRYFSLCGSPSMWSSPRVLSFATSLLWMLRLTTEPGLLHMVLAMEACEGVWSLWLLCLSCNRGLGFSTPCLRFMFFS